MASFRHFPDLPKDLPNIIWDYASRRSNSGVQIFELQGPEPKQDGETSNATTSDPTKYFPALDGGKGSSNVSTYMAGIGLWGACKESRDIMEKTTDRSKKALERDAKSEYLFFKYEKRLPAIGRCSTSQLFMVQPQADHFVLQPTKIENINRPQVARDIRKDLNPGGFPFDIDIGIEFNPEWESSWIRTFLTDFNVMCDAFRDIRAQLWVIDHNLKSKEPIPKGGSPDDCSFHVQDRKFFEVDYRWDPLREWRHIEPVDNVLGNPWACGAEFVRSLDIEADDRRFESRREMYGYTEDDRV